MTAALLALPLRSPILDGESLDSWIDAIARRCDTAPQQVVRALGIHHANQSIAQLIDQTTAAQLRRIEAATGLPAGRLDAACGSALSGAARLGTRGSRYCPRCLAETPGRWRLAWRSIWTVACTRHALLLLDVCWQCRRPPRTRILTGTRPPPVDRCHQVLAGSLRDRCCTDLAEGPAIRADGSCLTAQAWIDDLHDRIRDQDDGARHTLSDLPLVVEWLQTFDSNNALERAAQQVNPQRRRTSTAPLSGRTLDLDAARATVLLARAADILARDDRTAIANLRRILDGGSQRRLPPPKLARGAWLRLGERRFGNLYLRAIDSKLPTSDRLRMKTPTPQATLPGGNTTERARWIPQRFWPDWAARLLPTGIGLYADGIRAALAVLLTVPGDESPRMDSRATLLNPRIDRNQLSMHLQSLGKVDDGSALTAAIILLCRIADYLDEHGSPIDYERRREQIPVDMLSWEQWQDLAFRADAHPGDMRQGRHGRFIHARRHLLQLLCGTDLADQRHPLSFDSNTDRTRFTVFVTEMTSPLRSALREHAEKLLARLGFDEPLLWSPPPELADGLTLPGIDIDDIDTTTIRRIVVDEQRPPGDAATELRVHIEHVRLALERLDRPPRQWGVNAAPVFWRREQQAAALFTPEFFDREYQQSGRSLADLAADTGFGRHIIAQHAKKFGVDLRKGQPPLAVDPDWLREQYCQRLRTAGDIATELGTNAARITDALRRHGIPVRHQGIGSHPDIIAARDHLPPLVRAAVTGTLQGWKRLHRFRIAMAFPSLATAADYLGGDTLALSTQLQRLERDIGGQALFTAWRAENPTTPHLMAKRCSQNSTTRSSSKK